ICNDFISIKLLVNRWFIHFSVFVKLIVDAVRNTIVQPPFGFGTKRNVLIHTDSLIFVIIIIRVLVGEWDISKNMFIGIRSIKCKCFTSDLPTLVVKNIVAFKSF